MAFEKIKVVMELINSGKEYNFKDGIVYKNGKALKGSIGSIDGQKWWNLKSKSVQGQVLAYAMYKGFEALDPTKFIVHLDGNKLNNIEDNLIQLPKKGYAPLLEKARTGLAIEWCCY